MKKFLCLVFALMFTFSFVGCGEELPEVDNSQNKPTPSTPVNPYEKSLVIDKNFETGFHLNGLHARIYGDPIEYFCDIPNNLRDSKINFRYGELGYDREGYKETALSNNKWIIHQAASRYPFNDVENTVIDKSLVDGSATFNYKYISAENNNGVYLYENQSKSLGVNTSTGEISMLLKGSECYKRDRKYGEEWPHLVLLQHWGSVKDDYSYTCDEYALKNLESLKIRLDSRVDVFEDLMDERANNDIHSAICMFYLMLGYKAPTESVYSDFLYLGVTVFDNRKEMPEGGSYQDGNKASTTNKWIYNLPATEYYDPWENNLWIDGQIQKDKYAKIDVELFPFIERAFSDAKNGSCLKNATLEDMYVEGLYLGFELPGTYDLGMTFKNLDIVATLKK